MSMGCIDVCDASQSLVLTVLQKTKKKTTQVQPFDLGARPTIVSTQHVVPRTAPHPAPLSASQPIRTAPAHTVAPAQPQRTVAPQHMAPQHVAEDDFEVDAQAMQDLMAAEPVEVCKCAIRTRESWNAWMRVCLCVRMFACMSVRAYV